MHLLTVDNLPRLLPIQTTHASPVESADAPSEPFPRLTYYLPSADYREGSTVLILPGGGYGTLATAHEGHRPAQFLASHGIAAGVLEYRHAPARHPAPMMDACRALQVLKNEALKHNLETSCIGVLGFSAGGHLAGCLATRLPQTLALFGKEKAREFYSLPAFAILVYPVVTLTGPDAHSGSCRNLLGEQAAPALREQLSLQHAVSKTTCPMLLIHGQDDSRVVPGNSIALYAALTRQGIPASLHLYEGLDHGFGLAANHPWGREMLAWISHRAGQIRQKRHPLQDAPS